MGLFQSNRDHRLTLRRVIIEKWMCTAQVPLDNALVLGTSANIAIEISLKTRLYGLHFRRRLYGSIFDHFDIIGPKATKFSEKTQHNGHFAVQGHSRSLTLVPIESPYATSY